MKIRIDHLDANPFRHIDRYPIREEKIAALRESLSTTGFWDNLVGRQVGDRVQIAYGHHRREALVREYPSEHEVGIVVRDFDDDQMLQIMARENMEEWGSSAMVEMETVRAVVEAYGAGQIQLAPPDSFNKRHWRQAPSFASGATAPASGRSYTAASVASFLGWVQASGDPQRKVLTALSALEYIEAGHLTDEDFFGLSTKQAESLVEETRRSVLEEQRRAEAAAKAAEEAARRKREADERAERAAQEREAALGRAREAREEQDRERAEREYRQRQRAAEDAEQRRRQAEQQAEAVQQENARAEKASAADRQRVTSAVRDDLRRGGGYKNARQVADQARRESRDDAPRDLGKEVRSLASAFGTFLTESTMARRLNMVLGYRKYIANDDRHELVAGLAALRDDIDKVLAKLGASPAVTPTAHITSNDDVLDAEIV